MQTQVVDVRVVARVGEKLRAEWSCGGASVAVESPMELAAARSQGLSPELIREQFGRLGNTVYRLGEVSMEVGGVPFVQASLLNQMRREAVELLSDLQSAVRVVEVRDPDAALAGLAGKPARETAAGEERNSFAGA